MMHLKYVNYHKCLKIGLNIYIRIRSYKCPEEFLKLWSIKLMCLKLEKVS